MHVIQNSCRSPRRYRRVKHPEKSHPRPIGPRFWSRVDKTAGYGPKGECWRWTGTVSGRYGRFCVNGKQMQAHHVAYMLAGRAIPEGKGLCHECDMPLCVRESHLFPGTQRDNVHDCQKKGRWVVAPNENRPYARLTNDTAREARAMFIEGKKRSEIATHFNVSWWTINDLIAQRTWRGI
jgi:hypothetical protein